MAIKKSDLYSSLWASCDQLRGGMDASQYKDYVLFMLFIKYISDKYADSDDFAPPVVIPQGASFKDMVALKGKAQGLPVVQTLAPLIFSDNLGQPKFNLDIPERLWSATSAAKSTRCATPPDPDPAGRSQEQQIADAAVGR